MQWNFSAKSALTTLLIGTLYLMINISAVCADPPLTMFPNGTIHDFGKIRPGVLHEHSFRIVNVSKSPMKITDLRISSNIALRADAIKRNLAPYEEGRVVSDMFPSLCH